MTIPSKGLMDSRLGRGSLVAVPSFLLGILFLLVWHSGDANTLGQLSRRLGSEYRVGVVNNLGPWRETLETVVSPETADAIERDRQLRRSVGAAVDFTRGLTRDLGERFELPSLMEASNSLELVRKNLDGDDATKGVRKRTPGSPSLSERHRLLPRKPLFGLGKKNKAENETESSGNPLKDLGKSALDVVLTPFKDMLGSITNGITKNLGGAPMFLGIGIGAGAAQGLKIAPADKINQLTAKIAADNGQEATGLNPAIQSLGQGLSAAIVGAFNVSLLAGEPLSDVALKFADGLGSGVSSGLKLGGNNKQAAAPPSGSKASDVAGAFAFGLSNSVARSVNLSGGMPGILGGGGGGDGGGKGKGKGLDLSVLGKMFPGINAGSVAQGFARGLLQGAGDSIEAMGGVKALVNGTARMPTAMPNGTISFDDSITIGFGPSLNLSTIINTATFSKGVQTLVDLLRCEGISGAFLLIAGLRNSGALPKKSNFNGGDGGTPGAPDKIMTTIREVIPNGTITFVSGGNRYEVEGEVLLTAVMGSLFGVGNGIRINGHKIVTFAALLVVHIFIAVLIFVSILPLAMGLEGARSLLSRAQLQHALPRQTPRWVGVLWLFVTVPSLALILIFGALVGGNKPEGHFRTAHSVLGLITIILGIPAIALYYIDSRLPDVKVRIMASLGGGGGGDRTKAELRFLLLRTLANQVFQTLGTSAVLTGFGDLAATVLCFTTLIVPFPAAIAVGFAIASVSNVGQLLAWLDFYIAWRVSRGGKNLNLAGVGVGGGGMEEGAAGGKGGERSDMSPSSETGADYYGTAAAAKEARTVYGYQPQPQPQETRDVAGYQHKLQEATHGVYGYQHQSKESRDVYGYQPQHQHQSQESGDVYGYQHQSQGPVRDVKVIYCEKE
ncbi:hypothetical protein MAPG_00114 [Magnaporthiopsis poae ATCC 64411]|uniref:Cytochrome b561 domain-containing protein n=1 Tax=Magnaporthiopsis poae (strain ATCC 64411 / 73-15) TaxID=644358 RepID=A0A0C4DK52_MAGP6|nr:hypothetical protein MAPG_00114 [Magnaporthiopsis poae ATCC 64411]